MLSQSASHAFCIGYKPEVKWATSIRLVHTPAAGAAMSYKLKPAEGWKVHAEAALKPKLLNSSITYKAKQAE